MGEKRGGSQSISQALGILLYYKGKHMPGIISQLFQASSPRNIGFFFCFCFFFKEKRYYQWANVSHSAEFITVYTQF